MEGYILSKRTFKTIYSAPVLSYTLPVESISASNGSVVFGSTLSRDYAGYWLYVNDSVYHITQIEPDNGITTVTIEQAVEAFDRTLIYNAATAPAYIGSLILNEFCDNFQQCSDDVYRMSYLDLYNADSTALLPPSIDENGLYKLSDYIRTVRQLGITVRFRIVNGLLRINIAKNAAQEKTVLFGVNGATIDQQTYARTTTAKVTILQQSATNTYYLDVNGNITSTVPEERAEGEWTVVAVRDQAVPLDEAKKVFNKNINSHKITFRSNDRFNVYDVLRIRLDGTVYTTTVSSVTITDADNRYIYECGDLRTTMTQKFKAASSLEALGGVSNRGGSVDGNMSIAGKINIGEGMAIGGNFSVVGSTTIGGQLNANGKIKMSPDVYGSVLPTTDCFEGRLFFLLPE